MTFPSVLLLLSLQVPAPSFPPPLPAPREEAEEKKERPDLVVEGSVSRAVLRLDEVISSTRQRHPLLNVARQKIAVARGVRLEAMGAYDLRVGGKAGATPLGYYGERMGDVGFNQRLPGWGRTEFFGGYRIGQDFPSYEGKKVTGTLGEVRGGVRMQLAKDLWIDEDRLALNQADLLSDQMRADMQSKTLELERKAAASYFKWVAAGQKLRIARGLLEIAESRRSFLEQQVQTGARARIDLIDNQRQVFSRRQKVVEATQMVNEAALMLSLFLRDEAGHPRVVSLAELPDALPPPLALEDAVLVRALDELEARRPELRSLRALAESAAADRSWAFNQAFPKVEIEVGMSQDMGQPQSYGVSSSRPETEVGVQLKVELPVQRRKARGKMAQAEARRRAVQEEARYLLDAMRAEVRDTWVQLQATAQSVELARQAYEANLALEEAERRRLELGQSDLLTVNLRETATADSAAKLVDALCSWQVARAYFETAAGRSLARAADDADAS